MLSRRIVLCCLRRDTVEVVVVVAGSWGVLRIASAADTATVAASVGIVVSRV